jgi:hypothetical protein
LSWKLNERIVWEEKRKFSFWSSAWKGGRKEDKWGKVVVWQSQEEIFKKRRMKTNPTSAIPASGVAV